MNSHSNTCLGKNPNLWILDTGATNHIEFNRNAFISCINIIPISVNLHDGSHIIASMSGSVIVSPSLTLHNMPNFHVNLISVAKLVTNNECSVHFTADTFQIVQNASKAMIGTTRLQKGLYVLDSKSHSSAYNSIVNNSCNFWHSRLGHISDTGL